MDKEKLRIALISDYFYPNKGGVETHIQTVGEELIKMGHKVIVITHEYKGYKGLVMLGILPVYYLDIPIITMNTTFPTIFTNLTVLKAIFDKHKINIVHGHQSLSNLALEGVFHASHLNIKTVFTDHSVFELSKGERVLVNNLTTFVCKHLDWGVCVSNVSKINTHIRIGIPLERISIIPNGIIPEKFYPIKKELGSKIKVIYMSRLTFRKGVNLLADALPLICKDKNFEVLIVGNGPMKSDLEQVIDENDLNDQVKFLKEVDYQEVPNILRSGNIFLNTSLTETFCLANLEAAACGLIVVSTNVGGVSEVLDSNTILFCEPTAKDISNQIINASKLLPNYDAMATYAKILEKFSWSKVAKETEKLYYSIPEKKINLKKAILSFEGPRNFLCRLGILFEYIQITLLSIFESKIQRN